MDGPLRRAVADSFEHALRGGTAGAHRRNRGHRHRDALELRRGLDCNRGKRIAGRLYGSLGRLRRLDDRDALHLARRSRALAGSTGEAREQGSQEEEQFQGYAYSSKTAHTRAELAT